MIREHARIVVIILLSASDCAIMMAIVSAMYVRDTIAAIATPPGEGGIAIVRISGPDSLRIADEVFRGKGKKPSEQPTHVVLHGYIFDENGCAIDEVLLLIMRAPRTYTCEDVVEIQGHGGSVVAQRILRRVLAEGARVAEPGEFTKRAFLNGRIDLVQAEAVLDLINAKTERAACIAADQLCGHTSRCLSTMYENILAVLADMEATLDFPEDELPSDVFNDVISRIINEKNNLHEIISSWSEGRLLRDGGRIVISGKPNVGKSTLFNALVGSERAIVSHHPGTTRDTVEEWISIEGIPFSIVDTAGIRWSQCEIEQEGVKRARKSLETADIRLHVFDLSSQCDDHDREQIDGMVVGKSIAILNKADLPERFDKMLLPTSVSQVKTVASKCVGIEEVKKAIVSLLGGYEETHIPRIAISERHRFLCERAEKELQQALEILKKNGECAADMAAHHIREATSALAELLGRSYSEELLDRVFSRFCIGK